MILRERKGRLESDILKKYVLYKCQVTPRGRLYRTRAKQKLWLDYKVLIASFYETSHEDVLTL